MAQETRREREARGLADDAPANPQAPWRPDPKRRAAEGHGKRAEYRRRESQKEKVPDMKDTHLPPPPLASTVEDDATLPGSTCSSTCSSSGSSSSGSNSGSSTMTLEELASTGKAVPGSKQELLVLKAQVAALKAQVVTKLGPTPIAPLNAGGGAYGCRAGSDANAGEATSAAEGPNRSPIGFKVRTAKLPRPIWPIPCADVPPVGDAAKKTSPGESMACAGSGSGARERAGDPATLPTSLAAPEPRPSVCWHGRRECAACQRESELRARALQRRQYTGSQSHGQGPG